MRKVQIFVSEDLPGLGEAIKKIFPKSGGQLCVLHAVRDSLHQVRKDDREGLAQALRTISKAKNRAEAEEALRNLRAAWGDKYPKVVEKWEQKALALLIFNTHPGCVVIFTPPTSWRG